MDSDSTQFYLILLPCGSSLTFVLKGPGHGPSAQFCGSGAKLGAPGGVSTCLVP